MRGNKLFNLLAALVIAGTALMAGAPVAAYAATAGSTVGTGYWHTSGNQLIDASGNPVRAAGINWYGFETTDYVVHGLWSQDYHTIMNQIQQDGFNVIRLPFSLQMVQSDPVPSAISYYGTSGPINTDLQGLTALQVMDKIISYAGQLGLKVMLDCHRSAVGNSANSDGLWYNTAAGYTQQNWLNDWAAMVTRYNGNSTVIAADLSNEPHTPSGSYGSSGATWGTGNTATDWRLAAETAGNEILGINPHLLIVVEGISQYPNPNSTYQATWWGGDLQGAQQYPVVLNVPNQLVYSAHDYGPSLFQQPWFNANTSYSSLVNDVWNPMWGYLYQSNTAPVWVGEFGTDNTSADIQSATPGSQGQWFSDLVQYLHNNPNMNWTYWALNGEDSYGLLNNNYVGVANPLKLQLLQTIQFPLGAGSTTPPPQSSAPSIASLSPTSGTAGTAVTIAGSNFGSSQGSSVVNFGATAATVTSWSNTSVTATAPNLAAGTVNVTVSVGGTASNAASFTVTAPSTSGATFSISNSAESPNPTTPGTATNITVNFANTAPNQPGNAASDVTLEIELVNSSSQVVASQQWTGQNLAPQQTLSETMNWSASSVTGAYEVEGFVYSSSGASLAANTSVAVLTDQ
ncbi:MAG: cellulase family glycosylhydrolase [Bacilli bacterium]